MSINGTRIATEHDELGPIYVYQTRNSRILSFDGHVEQSCMNLNDPLQLMHQYTQAMMSCLLFQPYLKHATLMGIGAGSITKSLLHHFPNVEVIGVEYRQAVVKLARQFFELPDDSRLSIRITDAVRYMRDQPEKTDVIFSDLYNAYGMEPRQVQLTYLRNCKQSLNTGGMLILNLWHQDFQSSEIIEDMLFDVFDDNILSFPVEGGNTIVVAFKNSIPRLKRQQLLKRSEALQLATNIPASRYAKLIWSQQLHKFSAAG